MTTIYGIKNCDTMKKALTWLETNGVAYTFHDYKKKGIDETVLNAAIQEHGWETVINRRGTTWRNMADEAKEEIDAKSALTLAYDNPSIIKRPLLTHKERTYLGFKANAYKEVFNL